MPHRLPPPVGLTAGPSATSTWWTNIRPLVVTVVAVVAVHLAVLGAIWLVKGPPPWRFENVPAPVELATMAYLRLVLVVMIMAYGMVLLSPFTIGTLAVIALVRWIVRSHGHRRGAPRGLSG